MQAPDERQTKIKPGFHQNVKTFDLDVSRLFKSPAFKEEATLSLHIKITKANPASEDTKKSFQILSQ